MDNWSAQWRVNICLLFLQLPAPCSLREELRGAVKRNWKHSAVLNSLKWPHIYLDTMFLLNSYIPNYMDQNLGRETWSCAISLFLFIIPCVFLCVLLFVCLFQGLGSFFFFFGKTMSTLSIHFFILLKLANEQFEKNSVVMVVLVFIYYKTWLRKI